MRNHNARLDLTEQHTRTTIPIFTVQLLGNRPRKFLDPAQTRGGALTFTQPKFQSRHSSKQLTSTGVISNCSISKHTKL